MSRRGECTPVYQSQRARRDSQTRPYICVNTRQAAPPPAVVVVRVHKEHLAARHTPEACAMSEATAASRPQSRRTISVYDDAMKAHKTAGRNSARDISEEIGTSVEYLNKTFGKGLAEIDELIESAEASAFGPRRTHDKIMAKIDDIRSLQCAIFRDQFNLELEFESSMEEQEKQFSKKEPEQFCERFQQRFEDTQPRVDQIGNHLSRLHALVDEINAETFKTTRRRSTVQGTEVPVPAETSL